jgi:chromosome segregation ATPase
MGVNRHVNAIDKELATIKKTIGDMNKTGSVVEGTGDVSLITELKKLDEQITATREEIQTLKRTTAEEIAALSSKMPASIDSTVEASLRASIADIDAQIKQIIAAQTVTPAPVLSVSEIETPDIDKLRQQVSAIQAKQMEQANTNFRNKKLMEEHAVLLDILQKQLSTYQETTPSATSATSAPSDDIQATIDKIKEILLSHKNVIDELKSLHITTGSAISTNTTSLSKLTKRMDEISDDSSKARTAFINIRSSMDAQDRTLAEFNESTKHILQQTITTINGKFEAVDTTFGDVRNEIESVRNTIPADAVALRKEIDNAERIVAEQTGLIAKQRELINEAKEAFLQNVTVIKSLQQDVVELQANLANVRERISRLTHLDTNLETLPILERRVDALSLLSSRFADMAAFEKRITALEAAATNSSN